MASEPRALDLRFVRSGRNEFVAVPLSDGRILLTPLAWYPVIEHAAPAARLRWRMIGGGRGFSWPDLDVDLSIQGMLRGSPDVTASARSIRPRSIVYARALRQVLSTRPRKAG